MTNEDLVSRGKNESDECWGTYNDTTQNGWGNGFEYSCVHSGTIRTSGDLPTNWYNYTLASAGTIIDKNTSSESPAISINKTTESICAKGWTLPTNAQINANRDVGNFSPVLGGIYNNGNLYNESTQTRSWGSEAYNGALRSFLRYSDNSLSASSGYRYFGFYIRCVQAP